MRPLEFTLRFKNISKIKYDFIASKICIICDTQKILKDYSNQSYNLFRYASKKNLYKFTWIIFVNECWDILNRNILQYRDMRMKILYYRINVTKVLKNIY